MKHFTALSDLPDPAAFLKMARKLKQDPLAFNYLGKNKMLGLIFFNPSLRTRLSTQKAAANLGLSVIVMNIGPEGWALEFEDGAVMNGDKAEHIKDAAAVMGQYCDVIGVRTFAGLTDRVADYEEKVLRAFQQYAGVPILSLESATGHPLQAFADWITIEEHMPKARPKVVLTWAPHPRALPQAVANSFLSWMQQADVELVLACPPGLELAPEILGDTRVEHEQAKAFEGADFIYAKNWSSYHDYGKIVSPTVSWTVSEEKMALTHQARFMHCLPVRRNVVVDDAVIDSPNALVQAQALNRVYAAQAVLRWMLEG